MDRETEKKISGIPVYPYPVVYFDGAGNAIDTEESTKMLFAPWRQGKRILERQVERFGLCHACILRYGEEAFFTVMAPSPWAEGQWEMHLTRELFPALRRLSLSLLSCLETYWRGEEAAERKERVRQSSAALRAALSPYRRREARVSCSLTGFLKALSASLSLGGVALSYSCEKELCVLAEPRFLRELICSLIQFTGTVSAGRGLGCGLHVTESAVEIELYGEDGGKGMHCLEESFIREGEGGEEILSNLPFLESVLLCLQEEYGLRVLPSEGRTVLTLTLPRTDALPDAFLGKDVVRETDLLRSILSRRGFF